MSLISFSNNLQHFQAHLQPRKSEVHIIALNIHVFLIVVLLLIVILLFLLHLRRNHALFELRVGVENSGEVTYRCDRVDALLVDVPLQMGRGARARGEAMREEE